MEKIRTNEARQGRKGTQILVVLVVGLALAAAVWLGVELYGEAITEPGSATEPGAADTPAAPPADTAQ